MQDSTYQYSSADSAAIYNIAAQCPSDGGEGVWDARALYFTIINDIINFEDNCDAIGKSLIHHTTKPQENAKENFKLYPNPNDGNMTLEYNLTDTGIAEFSIFDVSGRIVQQQTLNAESKKETINAELLNVGLYYYTISVNGNRKTSNKLVIIK